MQQADEAVMVRLGIQESEELSSGFPTTAAELFGYPGHDPRRPGSGISLLKINCN